MRLLAGRRRQYRADRHNQINWVHAKHPFASDTLYTTNRNGSVETKFQILEKFRLMIPPAGRCTSGSEVDPEDQPGLVALEINEIQGGGGSGKPPPNLRAPGERKPRAVGQLQIRSGPGEQ